MRHTTFQTIAVCSVIGLAFAASADNGKHHGPKHQLPRTLVAFHSMYGVDGPFVGEANAIRGVPGDEEPWEIERASGRLDTEGHLLIHVQGLVFKDNPDPNLIGKNDEAEFRGLVSCLTEEGDSVVEAK